MFDLDAFISSTRDALVEGRPDVAVKEVVERAVSRPGDVDAALGHADRWGMRTLYSAADLTILQLVWPPHVVLFPHDHEMWAVSGIYGGGEDNIYYRRIGDGIAVTSGAHLGTGEVALLGSEGIHSVLNPHRTYTAAIHVYGGDYFGTPRSQWDPVSGEEQPFDVEAVRRTLADADLDVPGRRSA